MSSHELFPSESLGGTVNSGFFVLILLILVVLGGMMWHARKSVSHPCCGADEAKTRHQRENRLCGTGSSPR